MKYLLKELYDLTKYMDYKDWLTVIYVVIMFGAIAFIVVVSILINMGVRL